MVRHAISTIGLLLLAASLPVATPAHAQFDSIFGNGPPRPPADIPQQQQQPGYYPNGQPSQQQYPQHPDPRDYPDYRISRTPQSPRPVKNRDEPPAQPMPAPMSLPPAARPGGGTIESQPLAPLPGAEPAQQRANAPNPANPNKQPAPQQRPSTPQQQPAATQQANQPPAGQPPAPTDKPPTHEVVMQPPPQRISNPTAEFEGLDKITGRITQFNVAINETVQFGALQVTPKACYSRPPTETPQTDAFVDVDEVTLKGSIKRIFTGWMFKASPGLHAVEHPIYDVWLINCKGGKNPDVADASDSAGSDQASPTAKPARSTAPPVQPSARTRGSLPAIR